MAKTLYCPECGSDKLLAVGEPSLLDGKRARRCADCEAILAPPRRRWILLLVFAFGLGVTVFCVVLKWTFIANFGQPFTAQGHLFLGILLGPVVMFLSGREMFRRMPVTR